MVEVIGFDVNWTVECHPHNPTVAVTHKNLHRRFVFFFVIYHGVLNKPDSGPPKTAFHLGKKVEPSCDKQTVYLRNEGIPLPRLASRSAGTWNLWHLNG